MSLIEEITVENLDHLGIVGGLIDEIGQGFRPNFFDKILSKVRSLVLTRSEQPLRILIFLNRGELSRI